MTSSNKLFSLKKHKISPRTTEILQICRATYNLCLHKSRLHKECQGRNTQYLIMIERDPV